MTTTYRILGWQDDILDCDVCGRDLDRERVAVLEAVDTGARTYAGTTCAAKVTRSTARKVAQAADAAARETARQARLIAERRDRLADLLAIDPATLTRDGDREALTYVVGHPQYRATRADLWNADGQDYADRLVPRRFVQAIHDWAADGATYSVYPFARATVADVL